VTGVDEDAATSERHQRSERREESGGSDDDAIDVSHRGDHALVRVDVGTLRSSGAWCTPT